MQLFKLIFVQTDLYSRYLDDRFEQERFNLHVLNSRYEKIVVLWGTQPLVELLRWYQFIENHEGVSTIMKYLKDFTDPGFDLSN